jgi:hypothetical protein
MTVEQYNTVILPKIHGTQYLVKYMPPNTLDFFVMLSSIVGVVGGPSQSNYSSAGTFMDNYARHLTSIGQPATCMDLGWIQGAGYVEENKFASDYVASQGMQPISTDVFFRALSFVIKRKPETSEQSQLVLGLSHTLKEHLTRVARFSFLQIHRTASSGVSTAGPTQTKSSQQVLQSCKSQDEASTFIGQKLLEKISSLMAIPLPSLKLDGSIVDYGIDSLVAIEMRNWMRQDLGCNLGTFEILGSKSIASLGELATQRSRWLADADFRDVPDNKSVQSDHDSGIGSEISPTPNRSRSLTLASEGPEIRSRSRSLALESISDILPSLPVPSLETTTSCLLKSLRLVLKEDEYQRSEACIDAFMSPEGPGAKLQLRLLDHAKNTRNWHSDLWLDKQYWELRAPSVPFTNYFGIHEPNAVSSASQAAALICTAILQFQSQVENGTLDRDYLRDAAADMNQYKNMFNACRIPRRPKDTIDRFDAAANRHVAIIRDGHFFKLRYKHEGRRLNQAQLQSAMDWIIKQDLGSATGIGALTTLDRDTWADVSSLPLV